MGDSNLFFLLHIVTRSQVKSKNSYIQTFACRPRMTQVLQFLATQSILYLYHFSSCNLFNKTKLIDQFMLRKSDSVFFIVLHLHYFCFKSCLISYWYTGI